MGLPAGRTNNLLGRPKSSQSITPFLRIESEKIIQKKLNGKIVKCSKAEYLAMLILDRAMKGQKEFVKLAISYLDGLPLQKIDANVGGLDSLTKEDTAKLYAGFNETISKPKEEIK